MKAKKLLRNLAISSTTIIAAVTANAAFLLSDNIDTPNSGTSTYPGHIDVANRIVTGVTYSYQTNTNAPNDKGIGNTNPDIITNDKGSNGRELLDGYSERTGGNNATNSSWDNIEGATILFDLKKNYLIDHVSVSVGHAGNQGVGDYQVFISTDNITFTALGTWDGTKTQIDGAEATNPGRNTELSITATAISEARYIKIFLTNWNAALTTRTYHQLAIGEVAIWGDHVPAPVVPEPSTCALLAGATFLIFALLRRRAT